MGPTEPQGIITANKLMKVREVFETFRKENPIQTMVNSNKDKDLTKDNVVIEMKVIKELQLDVNNSRNKRRKIARDKKVSWKLYKKLEMLVTYRIQKGLNICTGETI